VKIDIIGEILYGLGKRVLIIYKVKILKKVKRFTYLISNLSLSLLLSPRKNSYEKGEKVCLKV